VHHVVRDGLSGGQGGLRDRPASVRLVPLPVPRRLRGRDANAERAWERRLGGVRARDAGDGEGDRGRAHRVPSSGIQLRVWVSRAGKSYVTACMQYIYTIYVVCHHTAPSVTLLVTLQNNSTLYHALLKNR
jgi:hypothetical protein